MSFLSSLYFFLDVRGGSLYVASAIESVDSRLGDEVDGLSKNLVSVGPKIAATDVSLAFNKTAADICYWCYF